MNEQIGSEDLPQAWPEESSEHLGAGPISGAMLSVYSYDRFLAVLRREISIDDYGREVAEHVEAQLPQG